MTVREHAGDQVAGAVRVTGAAGDTEGGKGRLVGVHQDTVGTAQFTGSQTTSGSQAD